MKKTLLKRIAATLAIALTLSTGATVLSTASTANASNYSDYDLYQSRGRYDSSLTHIRNIWKTCSSFNGAYYNTQLGIKLIVADSYATGNNIRGAALVYNSQTNSYEYTTVYFSKVNIPDEAGKSVYMGYVWAPEGSRGTIDVYNFNIFNDVINCPTQGLYF